MIPVFEILFYLIFVLIFLSITLYSIYVTNNDLLLKLAISMNRKYAGAKVKFAKRITGDGVWSYIEKGGHHRHHNNHHNNHHHHSNHKKYPTLVFIHGIGVNKDSWVPIIRNIPSYFHCIVLDLPGHGETTFINGVDEPNVESYVKSVREFLQVTHLDKHKIFLIGTSFGGAIAGMFAHYYPECIEKLALLCPAMKTPVLSEVHKNLMCRDYSSLIPQCGNDLIKIVRSVSNRNQYLPSKIMDTYFKLGYPQERRVLLTKILDNLIENSKNYETEILSKIKLIKIPTLIIWGRDDNIVHVSGAKYLQETIENSELHIFEDCNHALFTDKPNKTRKVLLDFIM